MAENLDTEELESLAVCFDNIRLMRKSNDGMIDNDDSALGDQFDEVLTNMIANLTENLATGEPSAADKGRHVIAGKREIMGLLVEKTLEYLRVIDPTAEVVLQELATQYESLLDHALSMLDNAPAANQSLASTGKPSGAV